MELNTEIITTPPADAATVVLLRDTADGLHLSVTDETDYAVSFCVVEQADGAYGISANSYQNYSK